MLIKNYGDMKIGNFQQYLISYILILLRFSLTCKGLAFGVLALRRVPVLWTPPGRPRFLCAGRNQGWLSFRNRRTLAIRLLYHKGSGSTTRNLRSVDSFLSVGPMSGIVRAMSAWATGDYDGTQPLTTLIGCPSSHARMLSAVVSMIRWRLSFGAQEMCGVMMQFLARSRGLSERMGSVDTTSSAAAATLPLFRQLFYRTLNEVMNRLIVHFHDFFNFLIR